MKQIPAWAVVGLVAFIAGILAGELHGSWRSRLAWGEVASMVLAAAVVLGVAAWVKSRPPSAG